MADATLDTLKRARDLIADPARWTQEEYARDADGLPVGADAGTAVCWCALGALVHSSATRAWQCEPYDALQTAMGDVVSDFNDTHPHPEVLAAFDAAIASEEARHAG